MVLELTPQFLKKTSSSTICFGSPSSLFCLPTNFRYCLESLMQSGSGLLGELPFNRSWEVCASSSLASTFNHLMLLLFCMWASKERTCSPCVPYLCCLACWGALSTLMRQARGLKDLKVKSQWGLIRNQTPCGITHSSAASFVFVVTYSQTQCTKYNVLVWWKRFKENELQNSLQEPAE